MSEQERRKRIRECYDAEKRREAGKISRSAADYWSDVASNPPAGRGQTTEDLASRMFGAMFGNIQRDELLGADRAFHTTMEKFSLTRQQLAAILWGEDVFQKTQSVLLDTLGVEEQEVTVEAKLVGDLGAEPIDFAVIILYLEKAFRIEIPRDALFSEAFLDSEDFGETPTEDRFASQLTVGDLCEFVGSLLKRPEAVKARGAEAINTEVDREDRVECPHCGKGYRIPPGAVGKKAVCKKCTTEFVIQVRK